MHLVHVIEPTFNPIGICIGVPCLHEDCGLRAMPVPIFHNPQNRRDSSAGSRLLSNRLSVSIPDLARGSGPA
jgi:hypothetical protein